MHEGHRQRMFEKLKGGGELLAEHEVLEILLYNALPRVNTNPLSHLLLETFGSMEGIFSADVESLRRVEGLGRQGASYLKCIGLVYQRYMRENKLPMPGTFEKESFDAYLKDHFSSFRYEVLEFFFLDEDGKILMRKTFTNREKHKVQVLPTDVTKAIMQNPGNSLMLAHNHLNGNPAPSSEDDRLTKQCEVICSINNMHLLDHFIVAGDKVYSYHENGRMSKITHNYSIHNILQEGENAKR
ncbi:MAG: RadC family protein [Clostridia bacterium]|nr:RadC family protein [Clostridia bacterium]